jgi:hypothetical protein
MEVVCSQCKDITEYRVNLSDLKTDAEAGSVKHRDSSGASVANELDASWEWSKVKLVYSCGLCSGKTTLHIAVTKDGAVCVSNEELDDYDEWYKTEEP